MNKKILISLGTIFTIVVIAVSIFVVTKVQKNNEGGNTDIGNVESNSGEIKEEIKEDEIIKVVGESELYRAYMIDKKGNLYESPSDSQGTFSKLEIDTEMKVVDIAATDWGLLIGLENGEYYLEANRINSDKEIICGKRAFKRIMLDDIVQYTTDVMYAGNNTIKLLNKKGELYELIDAGYGNGSVSEECESNVKLVMENVKKVKSNDRNVSIIDNNGNGYVYGYNLKEEAILGVSDDKISYEDEKTYISTPVKIGENIKEIDIYSFDQFYMGILAIYYINENDELYVMGQTINDAFLMGERAKTVENPIKLYDNVKEIYAISDGVIVGTNDGKVVEIKTGIYTDITTQIAEDYKEIICGDNRINCDLYIIKNDNKLYGYGLTVYTNTAREFGIGDEDVKSNTLIEIKENVKKVFPTTIFHTTQNYIITNDGKLYGAGSNKEGALGIPGKEIVATWEEINY